MNNFQDKANFIWQVADDILRGSFKQHEYGDVILPFVVLRRLDCVLEDHKDAVIAADKKFKDILPDPSKVLLRAANGLNFYNTSYYDLRRLAQDAGNIEMNFSNIRMRSRTMRWATSLRSFCAGFPRCPTRPRVNTTHPVK